MYIHFPKHVCVTVRHTHVTSDDKKVLHLYIERNNILNGLVVPIKLHTFYIFSKIYYTIVFWTISIMVDYSYSGIVG